MQSSSRSYSILTLVVLATGTLAGGFLGTDVAADSPKTEDQFWTFGRVLALVEDEYIGDINSEDLVEGAIRGMLGELDPHTAHITHGRVVARRHQEAQIVFPDRLAHEGEIGIDIDA